MPCVNSTIEIALEQIQCDIAVNFAMSKLQQIRIMCVKALTSDNLNNINNIINMIYIFIYMCNMYQNLLCFIDCICFTYKDEDGKYK